MKKFKYLSVLVLFGAILYTGDIVTNEAPDFDTPTIEQIVLSDIQIYSPETSTTLNQTTHYSAFSQTGLPADNDRLLYVISPVENERLTNLRLNRLYLPRSDLSHSSYFA